MDKLIIASTLALSLLAGSISAASARRFGYRGAEGGAGAFKRGGQYGTTAGAGAYRYGRGAAGAVGGSYRTPYGGTFKGGAAGFATPNRGAVGGAYGGTTAAGGTYKGAGGAAWKRGVGGVEQSGSSGTTANGSTYSGYTKGSYNAQTGQGSYASARSFDNAATGQQYGYNETTQFTKGQGGETTLDTQNHGDYQVDWQKGQKPVVTQTSAPSGGGTVAPPAVPVTTQAGTSAAAQTWHRQPSNPGGER